MTGVQTCALPIWQFVTRNLLGQQLPHPQLFPRHRLLERFLPRQLLHSQPLGRLFIGHLFARQCQQGQFVGPIVRYHLRQLLEFVAKQFQSELHKPLFWQLRFGLRRTLLRFELFLTIIGKQKIRR